MQTRKVWHKRLQKIDLINDAGLLDWQAIKTGTSNHNFKVTTQAGTWVVRINRASLGINRHEEKKILAWVEQLGVGPKIIENNPDSGYLITEFITQPAWHINDFKAPKKQLKLQNSLNQFQSLSYDYLPSRLDRRLRLYLKKIKGIPVKISLELLNTIQKLDFLGFWDANNTLYHSDLNPNNIFGHKQPTIIDWEFAGQGHPFLDWLILEHETKIDLSSHYPEDINPAWIEPAKRMVDAMMSLWPKQSP